MFSMLVVKATAFYSFNEVDRASPLWCCLEITDSPKSQTDLEASFKLLTMARFSLAKGCVAWLRSLLLYYSYWDCSLTSYKKDSTYVQSKFITVYRSINKKGKVNQWGHFIDLENVELLLIKHVDVVLWIGQSPGKGVFALLIFVQFHQQTICYCSIVVIHLLFSSPTARTSAKRFWIWACWDRAHYFYIFMNCVVHWHSFSRLLPRAHARMTSAAVGLCAGDPHVQGSHRGLQTRWRPEVLQLPCCRRTELSTSIWVMQGWGRGTRGIYGILWNCDEE